MKYITPLYAKDYFPKNAGREIKNKWPIIYIDHHILKEAKK